MAGGVGPYSIKINPEKGLAIDMNAGQAYQIFRFTNAAIWMHQIQPVEESETSIMMIEWSGPDVVLAEDGNWLETIVHASGHTTTPRRGTCSRVS